MKYRFRQSRGWKNQSLGRVDQSSQVEHYLRRDKGHLLEVDDKTQLIMDPHPTPCDISLRCLLEVYDKTQLTTETDVAGALSDWLTPLHGRCHRCTDTSDIPADASVLLEEPRVW